MNKTNNRLMNLTTVKKLNLTNSPEEIWVFNIIKKPIRFILTNFNSDKSLDALHSFIENLIDGESLASNAFSEGSINVKGVALVIDVKECDTRVIITLNSRYQTFDINHIKPLSFFLNMREYGETLDFPLYDFFQLALKCMCTVNTRIGPMFSCPGLLSDSEYGDLDFLALIKQITKEKAFTLEIEGIPHYISSTQDGWLTIDGELIRLLSKLSENLHEVILRLYQNQPDKLH